MPEENGELAHYCLWDEGGAQDWCRTEGGVENWGFDLEHGLNIYECKLKFWRNRRLF